MSTPDEPGSQNNTAHDGGVQNIAQGGNVYNLNVYPPASGESAGVPAEPAPSGQRARVLSGRRLALAVGAAVTVIAVPTTILALQYGPLRTENVDSARSAPPAGAPSSPSGSAASPSAQPSASASASAVIAGPTAPAAAAPETPKPSAAPTRRSATASSAYPSKDVACATRWFTAPGVPDIEFQPCTQAVSGSGGAQFGVMVRNGGATQLVVTVLVQPVVTATAKGCPLQAGPWQQVVIDPGKTWYSQFEKCSLGNEVKGHRVQSAARVALDPASDADLGKADLHYSRAFDISTSGTATVAG
ncbi:hypothetical protein [Streptomyces sp. NPDC097981]|uniref:hypothetical protein n=1 Tax=Streptomyces sp. NPDC097981 TaxID=3155428 RepID=UPI003318ACD6